MFYLAQLALVFASSLVSPVALAQSTRICNVASYGAKADGKTLNTKAIQAAIDDCTQSDGTVLLSGGTYVSGTLELKSNIEFKIDATATLKGSQNDADYPDLHPHTQNSQLSNCRKSLLYSDTATHITIDGGGKIDGSGDNPKWVGKEATRPMAIFLALSNTIVIHDISLKNAGMWGLVTFETDHVKIERVQVSTLVGPTRDGIDIVDGHDVLVDHVDVSSEDDSICLKTGSAHGLQDVTVSNSTVQTSYVANGLKLGTASVGYFKNVLFQNISVRNVDKAAIAVESVDGAAIENVRFENIQFHNAGAAIFVLLGSRANAPIGTIRNVSFDTITGDTDRHTWGSAISGTQVGDKLYPIENLSLRNVLLTSNSALQNVPAEPKEYAGQYPDPNLWGDLPASGIYFRHVRGLTFINSSVKNLAQDKRPTIVKTDVIE